MKKLKVPVGTSDFTEIRRENCYYIDKTNLISGLVEGEKAKVTLITRPRRFGKTLAMNMLAHFFDIRENSRELFRGLEITKNHRLCTQWQNQYPTIFLSLKDIDGQHFENAYALLRSRIASLYDEHRYLETSDKVTEMQRELFTQIKRAIAPASAVQESLRLLSEMMAAHYGKPAILLLDEYDVPIAKASTNGYYREMMDIIKVLMGAAFKDNPALCFAVVTGCLKIAKESVFTGTNNFVSDTITSSRLNEFFGFTQAEVDRLLADAELSERKDEIKAWYDGYHFGDADIYCPWDVMNFIRDLNHDPKAKPASYWKNTSDNGIIRSFIDFAGSSITRKLETLLEGGYITQRIEEELTYDYLHSTEDNLWSILYLTGYLTRLRDFELERPLPSGVSALIIPNAEVREIYTTTIVKWFDESANTWNRKALFDALWQGDAETIQEEMNKLLRRTISYHDYREDFYHAFLAGIFTGAGFAVESNKEHGEGRSDIVIYDIPEAKVAIFEAKYARSQEDMEKCCNAAIQQIDEKSYASEFEDDYNDILCYGIAFFKKRCQVQIKKKRK